MQQHSHQYKRETTYAFMHQSKDRHSVYLMMSEWR